MVTFKKGQASGKVSKISTTLIIGLLGLASACSHGDHHHIKTTSQPVDTAVQETAQPVGPEYVEDLGYKLNWAKTDDDFITAPKEIKDQALALCQQDGFVRVYMRSISFDDQAATGYFSCTGDSGN